MARRAISVTAALVKNVPRAKKILVAVSGGIDSVVLLHGLSRVQRLLKTEIHVAHVDHALRPDSSRDLLFVRDLAAGYDLPFYSIRLTRPKASVNLEDWGRRQRYSFFKKILKDKHLDLIATAHHSSDLTETFLMRLISNKELRGIEPYSRKLKLIRPLLQVTKKQIEAHQKKFALAFREDSTNSSSKFLRNKVRNNLIPLLEKDFQPRINMLIAERARDLADDLKALDSVAESRLLSVVKYGLQDKEFQDLIKAESASVGWRMIDLHMLGTLGFRLGRKKCLVIREVLLGKLRKADLPGGLKFQWKKQKLHIVPLTG